MRHKKNKRSTSLTAKHQSIWKRAWAGSARQSGQWLGYGRPVIGGSKLFSQSLTSILAKIRDQAGHDPAVRYLYPGRRIFMMIVSSQPGEPTSRAEMRYIKDKRSTSLTAKCRSIWKRAMDMSGWQCQTVWPMVRLRTICWGKVCTWQSMKGDRAFGICQRRPSGSPFHQDASSPFRLYISYPPPYFLWVSGSLVIWYWY